jgi:single-strand DNA-binding protein
MADGLNRVMLLGNLGADPELRMTSSGQAVLKMRLATSESYLDKNKVRQERTEWHALVLWGKRAEALAKILSKGSRIFVEGSNRTTSYEKDGQKRYKTEVNVNNVILSGSKPGSGGGGGGGGVSSSPQTSDESDYGGGEPDNDIPF